MNGKMDISVKNIPVIDISTLPSDTYQMIIETEAGIFNGTVVVKNNKTSLCSAIIGRNPQTGKEIQIAAKKVVGFKAGKELTELVK